MSRAKGLNNEEAWRIIFERYDVLTRIERDGCFEISAGQIKEYREPRLMAKFDHKKNLPPVFSNNNLSILPTTRGNYIIAPVKAYKEFEESHSSVERFSPPEHIESINFNEITGESVALNSAYVSGILADFLDDEEVIPTLGGRMSSGVFEFNIERVDAGFKTVKVNNAQVEIDGGYEGIRNLALTEVKLSLSDDFIIRQLYYPFRTWFGAINKEIKTVFMMYTNGIYRLYEYRFEDPCNYNSLVLVKQKNYTIEDITITLEDIISVMQSVSPLEEPAIAFPQADSFDRVINLCELLNDNPMTKDDITNNYDFDPRQTNYYTDAGRYLGLIDKARQEGQVVFYLTAKGIEIMRMKYRPRQLKLVDLILQHKPFKDTLEQMIGSGEKLDRQEIVNIMKDSKLYNIREESTYQRRASTVRGWCDWILGLQEV